MFLSLFACACKNSTHVISNRSIDVIALVDITDQQTVLPQAESILKLYDFDSDRNIKASFSICSISDRQLNPQKDTYLPNGSVTEKDNLQDDPYYREKQILSFYNGVRKDINDFIATNKNDTSLNHSECFRTIADELSDMKNNQARKKILLIFSDLQENSNLFDCYKTKDQELLDKKQGEVLKIFEQAHLLPNDLKGIITIFIFNPRNRKDDQHYMSMVSVYKKILKSRGAIVKVQANSDVLNYSYE
ncbi:MAG: hypothetical protein Q8935_00210 [Bacillota bacterium]|nr:hypothetical protein [Bacillota bacterium]